jgi:hypothetical protein
MFWIMNQKIQKQYSTVKIANRWTNDTWSIPERISLGLIKHELIAIFKSFVGD